MYIADKSERLKQHIEDAKNDKEVQEAQTKIDDLTNDLNTKYKNAITEIQQLKS